KRLIGRLTLEYFSAMLSLISRPSSLDSFLLMRCLRPLSCGGRTCAACDTSLRPLRSGSDHPCAALAPRFLRPPAAAAPAWAPAARSDNASSGNHAALRSYTTSARRPP